MKSNPLELVSVIERSLRSIRIVSVAAAFAAAAAGVPALAQRAPELLPANSVLIAGGGAALVNGKCPVSGVTATDTFGDGCLATEIQIGNTAAGGATPGARDAVADASGNVFFTDYNNNLVRRVDAVTGIVTAVAGGPTASPATGAVCGTSVSLDGHGDGCPANLVHLSKPAALAFAPNGDLYFSEIGQSDVRKIAATGGVITTTGIISNIAGTTTGTTYGYVVSNASTTIVAATQSYLDSPYALAFDANGDLFIAEQYKNAIFVVNLNATGSTTVNGVKVAAGTIWKVAGTPTTGGPDCPNGTTGTFGCNYNKYTEGAVANATFLDNPYGVAADTAGNTYFSDEYYNVVPVVSTAGVLTTYAGSLSAETKQANTERATAGTFGIGSTVGLAIDVNNNLYVVDSTAGLIWRVDADTKTMYAVAGGGAACSSATDAYGDGCPALQATFGATGTTYSSFTLPGPGLFGVSVDTYGNLITGDTETNLVRKIGTGAQFGAIGNTQPTNTLIVHFAPNDGPATATPYTLTTGANSFTLGTPGTCTTNADKSKDCPLPLTANPTVLGAFTGTLKVTSSAGLTASFPLSGTFVTSPVTRTTVSATAATTCTGSTSYSTTNTITLVASISSTGTPTGTVQFYDYATAVGNPVAVSNGSGTLNTTFAAGIHSITATYSGDSSFTTSTSTKAALFTTSVPAFSIAPVVQVASITAGGTGLFSFNVTSNVYAGTLAFACTGLPAGATCVFSPQPLTTTACTSSSTVALNIFTTQATPIKAGSFGVGRGTWNLLAMFAGLGLALGIGLRRRQMRPWMRALGMMLALVVASSGLMACSSNVTPSGGTPSGMTYSVTVTATGTPTVGVVAGGSQSLVVTLTVK